MPQSVRLILPEITKPALSPPRVSCYADQSLNKCYESIDLSSFGKPDVLQYIEVNEPALKQDGILVKIKAIGLIRLT
jgi:hypothetical protein